MNQITIWHPRWHDRTILVADYKIGQDNEIRIQSLGKDGQLRYPNPIHASGSRLKSYPAQTIKSRQGNEILMRVVPLEDLI